MTAHWQYFKQFCHYEKLSGGPDPQIPTVGEMSKGTTLAERRWRAAVYVSVYNVPCAEFLWREWPWAHSTYFDQLPTWLEQNWSRITTRFERRCVRSPAALGRFLNDAHLWLLTEPVGGYEALWRSCLRIKFMGRYAALKFLRALDTFGDVPNMPPDLRPQGGWSPLRALAMIAGDQEPDAVLSQLNDELAMPIDMFEFQTLLCEYRECYEGQRQYPGRSLDSELGYARKYPETEMFATRAAIFPHEHLGELQGWDGPRKELGRVLRQHGYMWSDTLFDYTATEDFATPVRRDVRDIAATAIH